MVRSQIAALIALVALAAGAAFVVSSTVDPPVAPAASAVARTGSPDADTRDAAVAPSDFDEADEVAGGQAIYEPELAARIEARSDELQRCYEQQLRHDPTLGGRITIALTIDTRGQLTNVHVVHDELGAEVAACVVARLAHLPAVDPPLPDESIDFTFPLVFTPGP